MDIESRHFREKNLNLRLIVSTSLSDDIDLHGFLNNCLKEVSVITQCSKCMLSLFFLIYYYHQNDGKIGDTRKLDMDTKYISYRTTS